ncbi:hypothetical protein PDESU_02993 [Pontiella desulfatans]|uniref:Uncharacterized protein n=1 Tax=Pontiella desulfatans TaxID=2750659 RepID=A0A6C2U350_PONDE|nr:hypothetical protein [Pontiella desulfatans]VGO14432.1 hypothetical protein PDESU_02993 [Pontiella desulfatans]
MDDDYIVLDQYGNYWAGNRWSELPDNAVNLTIQNAAELVMDNLPADILVGEGDMIKVWLGFEGDSVRIWVDYPDGLRSYQKRSEAIQSIINHTGSR